MARFMLLCDDGESRPPVVECGEALRELRDVPVIRIAASSRDDVRARASVVDRLVAAQTLLPAGVRLLIIECYRPAERQLRYFEEHCARLAAHHPEWTVEQVVRAVRRYVAAPEHEPHVTGATVDLTLCSEDGAQVPLGPLPVGPCAVDPAPGGPPATNDELINRDALSAALRAVGLVNNPVRWWHWSYGDRYWAEVTGRPAARYGPLSD